MYRLEYHKSQHGSREYAQYLTHVGSEQELYRLSDVVIDSSALFNRAYYSCEVIVCEYHVRHVLCNVGSRDPHANADVCGLDARSIVYAVSGHRGYIAFFLPHVYDANLVFRLHAGINADVFDFLFELIIAHLV